ncbi:MAG TPA: YraN family protein [Beijerinckiaceae bacterium]|mgnify:CR=1 FL=1|nr:YraN family protein [Beijerinckiaceae bacterium]
MPGGAKRSHATGFEAEWLAAAVLRLKGYSILAKRYTAAGGEIDLVARRGGTLVFVEVKARQTMDEALGAISADKRRRVSRAARAYLARLPSLPATIRFDAIYLAPGRLPRHHIAVAELDLD